MSHESPIKLMEGEVLREIKEPSIRTFQKDPSVIKALYRLTNVSSSFDFGKSGPSLGSISSEENLNIAELRRYELVFGRDSLRIGLDLFERNPLLLKNTVLELAKYQGVELHTRREEEPGRIPHEIRDPKKDPVAREITKKSGWEWPFYGSVDATLLYISSISKIVEREGTEFLSKSYLGKDGEEHTVFYSFHRAMDWLGRRLDSNPQGLLEFKPAFVGGHLNQAWRDSWDAYHDKDGRVASHNIGIASLEVQVLAYDALLDGAGLFEKTRFSLEKAGKLKEKADKLKEQIMNAFWVKNGDEEFFALGTERNEEGNLIPLDVKTSDMGHLLNSRILEGREPEILRRKELLIRSLFAEDMLSAGGIRTLSNKEKRFREGSYQNGSVWLWDNYCIAEGLERHEYFGLAEELSRRILEVVGKFKIFPEFVRGDQKEIEINKRIVVLYDNINKRKNTVEQPPQEIQGWTASALYSLKFKCGKIALHPEKKRKTKMPQKMLEDEILNTLENK